MYVQPRSYTLRFLLQVFETDEEEMEDEKWICMCSDFGEVTE